MFEVRLLRADMTHPCGSEATWLFRPTPKTLKGLYKRLVSCHFPPWCVWVEIYSYPEEARLMHYDDFKKFLVQVLPRDYFEKVKENKVNKILEK